MCCFKGFELLGKVKQVEMKDWIDRYCHKFQAKKLTFAISKEFVSLEKFIEFCEAHKAFDGFLKKFKDRNRNCI
jgi:hypothetical protein